MLLVLGLSFREIRNDMLIIILNKKGLFFVTLTVYGNFLNYIEKLSNIAVFMVSIMVWSCKWVCNLTTFVYKHRWRVFLSKDHVFEKS